MRRTSFLKNSESSYRIKIWCKRVFIEIQVFFSMGVIACRSLYLPDPKFLMDRLDVKKYLNLMNKYCELPPRRTRKGRKIEKK